MTDRPWFRYDGQSSDELFALADSHRIDSLVCAFENAIGRKAHYRGDSSLSQVERDCLAIEELEREVNNGGYAQFLGNSSNVHAATVVDALRRCGCEVTAVITAQAIEALGPGVSLAPEALDELMAAEDPARDERLGACDERYYASGENIAAILFDHMRRHRDAVRFTREDVAP